MQKFQMETNEAIKLHQKMLKAHRSSIKYMSIFTQVKDGKLVITNEQTLIRVFKAIDAAKAELFEAGQRASTSKEAI